MKIQNNLIRIGRKYNLAILVAFLQIIEKLERKHVIRYWILVVLDIFSGFLESLATVWIAIFASTFTNTEELMNNRYLNLLFGLFGANSSDNILRAIGLAAGVMLILIVLKNISFSISSYYRGKFLATVETYFQSEIMRKYLGRPYEWFLKKSESELMQTIDWTNHMTNVLNHIILSISNLTTMIILFGVLIIYNLSVSLPVMLILSVIGTSTYMYIKNRIDNNERMNRRNISKSNSAKHTIIYDFKNIKINSVGRNFYNKFVNPIEKNIQRKAKVAFLQASPMFVFEILGFGIITFIAIFLPRFFNWTVSQTMQYISLVAVTAWRIIPAMNRFVSNQAKIRSFLPFVEPVFKTIYDESFSYKDGEVISNDCHELEIEKISFKNVNFSYEKDSQPIIDNLTLDIHSGDKIGVVGVSGSGKTTFIDLFSGILRPDDGSILFNDRENINNIDWRRRISYLPQSVRLFSGTLEENIVFGYSEEIDKERLSEIYRLSILDEIASREENGEDVILSSMGKNLSGGQAQRLGIGRLLYRDTEVLIIDEGTASLDQVTEKRILSNIFNRARDKILLLVTHHFDNLSYCNKILAFTGNRKIIFGARNEVLPLIENKPDFFYEDEKKA